MFWTISDNWEWADGYGPKFGLVAVDRANDLARIPRQSYHLFSKVDNFPFFFFFPLKSTPPNNCFLTFRTLGGYHKQIVNSGKITREDRIQAWSDLHLAAKQKMTRPFYRAVNKHGLMYAGKFMELQFAKLELIIVILIYFCYRRP